MPQQGPTLCEEYLPYNELDGGFVVCHTELDIMGECYKVHASTRDVAERFHTWGYNQGLTEVYFCILNGMPTHALKEYILEGLPDD